MEAEDTIMTDAEVKKELSKYTIPEVFTNEETSKNLVTQIGNIIAVVRKAQADVSFGAGKQKGIREVVEWLNMQLAITPEGDVYKEKVLGGQTLIEFRVLLREWQAKLKEWGLE